MPRRTFPTRSIKNHVLYVSPTKFTDIIAKKQNEIHFLKILVLTPPEIY